MKRSLVTIGIPCFNCARFLPALLRSLDAQTFVDWEAIAIDDCSTDGTADLLRSIRHPKVRVILGTENLGLGARLNQIHRLADTDFIARTDADDLLHPERLSKQIECFEKFPATDVCATGTYSIDNCDRLLGVRRIPRLATTPREVMLRNGPSHPTITARRSWFIRFPYQLTPKRGQDLDLWTRSVGHSRIVQLDEPLHFIREDPAFDFAKYQRSMRDHREVFRRNARLVDESALVAYALTKSLTKELVYGILNAFGAAPVLASRRNLRPTDAQLRSAQAILDYIGAGSERAMAAGGAVPLSEEAEVSLREVWQVREYGIK